VQRLLGKFDVPEKQKKNQPWIHWQKEFDHPVFSIWDASGSLEAMVGIEKREFYQWLMAKVRDHDGFEWFSKRERCRILYYFETCPDPEKLSVGPNYYDDGNEVGWSYDGSSESTTPIRYDGDVIGLLTWYRDEDDSYLLINIPAVDIEKAEDDLFNRETFAHCKFRVPHEDPWQEFLSWGRREQAIILDTGTYDTQSICPVDFMGKNWDVFDH
jgi:hypothetical protein